MHATDPLHWLTLSRLTACSTLLLESAVKATVAVALAALFATALRGASAAARHRVWCAALFVAMVLPVLAAALPRWSLALPQATRPDRVSSPGVPGFIVGVRSPSHFETAGAGPAVAASAAVPARLWLLGIWLAGAASTCAWFLRGAAAARRLAAGAEAVSDPSLLAQLGALAAEAGVTGRVRLLRAAGEVTPMTWGHRRPVLLLPRGAAAWSEARRRVVLLHELAHVRRRDALTQTAAGLACAVHWFNPLVWLAARRQRLESERACDEAVLRGGTPAADYAEHLVEIARRLIAPPPAAAALDALAMARRSELERRVRAILAPRPPAPRRGPLAALTLFAMGALLPLAALHVAAQSAPAPSAPEKDAAAMAAAAGARPGSRQTAGAEELTFAWADGKVRYLLRVRGKVELTADGGDVRDLAAGASLFVEAREGSSSRRFEARHGSAAAVERSFSVDGAARPLDDTARRFLADALASLDRQQAQSRQLFDQVLKREADQRGNVHLAEPAPPAAAQPPAPPPPPGAAPAPGSRSRLEPPADLRARLLAGADTRRDLEAYLARERDFRARLLARTAASGADVEPRLREELERARTHQPAAPPPSSSPR